MFINFRKKMIVPLAICFGLVTSGISAFAAPSLVRVDPEGAAAYISGNMELSEAIFTGDMYLKGDLYVDSEPVRGKTGINGTIYNIGEASKQINGDAAESYEPIAYEGEYQSPVGEFTVLDRPETLPERGSFTIGWNDYQKDEDGNFIYDGLAINRSGHYDSITAKGPIYFDTTERNIVVTVDKLELTQAIRVVGSGSVTIYTVAQETALSNCTVVKEDETSSFNMVAYGGDLTVKGYISIPGNLYVPDGSINMTSANVTGLLYVGGTDAVFSGNNTGVNGILYAPNSKVRLMSGARIFGTLVAEELSMNPGSKVAYDPAYFDLNLDDGNWDISDEPEQPDEKPVEKPDGKPVEPTEPEKPGDDIINLEPVQKPEGLVTGLKAEYYAYFNAGERAFPKNAKIMEQRLEAVRLNHGWDSPDENLMRKDRFSIRITGYIIPQQSGEYTFSTLSDDGVFLKLSGTTLIENWNDMSLDYSYAKTVSLEAGQAYEIELEYFENEEVSTLALFWQYGDTMELVPATVMYTQPMQDKTYFNEAKYQTKGLLFAAFNSADGAINGAREEFVTSGIVNLDSNSDDLYFASNPDEFSAIFSGELEAPQTGELTLIFAVDDAIKVEFDGAVVLDEWHANSVDDVYYVNVNVKAGERYPIKIYYNNVGQRAVCQMFWQCDGINMQLVPQEFLFSK